MIDSYLLIYLIWGLAFALIMTLVVSLIANAYDLHEKLKEEKRA